MSEKEKRVYEWDIVSDVEFMFGCGTRVDGSLGVRFYPKFGVGAAIDAYLDEFARSAKNWRNVK